MERSGGKTLMRLDSNTRLEGQPQTESCSVNH